ncbi:MAG TPA: GNAT family N-acetyltransferase [Acidimicrobiales bacterium]|nr:GNAT family N-acetyltransferase [Acidimicrobiales bacterium]
MTAAEGPVPVLRFREMRLGDLGLVTEWLDRPHVARWYLAGSSVGRETAELRESIVGTGAVHALIVAEMDRPVGWCQWYRCGDDPEWAFEVGAEPGDVGIDYAIGEPHRIGRGVGTALVAGVVRIIRRQRPSVGVVATPDGRNIASRRVLEKNGFQLLGVRALSSEPTDDDMAIYRLPPPAGP